jgi:ppGpp synthetase/RelA/SpoT-type nucleotidyltranferase
MAIHKAAIGRRYKQELKRYERAQDALMSILQNTVDDLGAKYSLRPVPMIQGEVKKLDSFFDKALRLEQDDRVACTQDCFNEIGDVSRGRIICQTLADCERVVRLLEDNKSLFVDRRIDVEMHAPSPTGYRAIHLDASVDAWVDGRDVATPCEIQIMTALQYAWGLYTHGDVYKGDDVPELVADLMRELSNLLHVADKLADRLIDELDQAPADAAS